MPERLDPARAAFLLEAPPAFDGPVLVLAAGRELPALPQLPSGTTPELVEDWVLLRRLTLCVLDGPGDEGFLIAPLGPELVEQMDAWCAAVDRSGTAGLVVLSQPELPDPPSALAFLRAAGARGAMIRAVPAGGAS